MRPRALIAALGTGLFALSAPRADAGETRTFVGGSFLVTVGGVKCGYLRSSAGEETTKGRQTLTVTATEITPALAGLVGAFVDGKVPAKELTLSSGAVLHKANEARLASVRLPAVGAAAPDLAFTFETTPFKTSPLLKLASDEAKPPTAKVDGFRVALGDMPSKGATRIEAIVLEARDGAAVPGRVAFDVPSSDAPAFAGWAKAKSPPREGAVEYTSKDGAVVLRVRLERCAPSSVSPDGPITHVVLTCARARRG